MGRRDSLKTLWARSRDPHHTDKELLILQEVRLVLFFPEYSFSQIKALGGRRSLLRQLLQKNIAKNIENHTVVR